MLPNSTGQKSLSSGHIQCVWPDHYRWDGLYVHVEITIIETGPPITPMQVHTSYKNYNTFFFLILKWLDHNCLNLDLHSVWTPLLGLRHKNVTRKISDGSIQDVTLFFDIKTKSSIPVLHWHVLSVWLSVHPKNLPAEEMLRGPNYSQDTHFYSECVFTSEMQNKGVKTWVLQV